MVYLFLAGLACFVAAVFVYNKSEDNSIDKFVSETQETRGEAKRANDKCEELKASFQDMIAKTEELRKSILDANNEWSKNVEAILQDQGHSLKKIADEIDILKIRQHTMDKKIIAKEQTFNLKTEQPIAVEIVTKPPATKGKGKDTLLKRSGVTP